MLVPLSAFPSGTIYYPESDGKPMADNSKQFEWITMLAGNLRALYDDRPDVFVCGDQNWFPVEGDPSIVCAPDVYVVFGRPKGYRGSYKQWEEDNIPMTVVFEVLSPSNSPMEMADKLVFYEDYGVEEYYLIDPLKNSLAIYLRQGQILRRERRVDGFVSPRMQIRFQLGEELQVFYPDGRKFVSFEELEQLRQKAEARAETAEQRAESLLRRSQRLIELGRKVRLGQASAEELRELEELERTLLA